MLKRDLLKISIKNGDFLVLKTLKNGHLLKNVQKLSLPMSKKTDQKRSSLSKKHKGFDCFFF